VRGRPAPIGRDDDGTRMQHAGGAKLSLAGISLDPELPRAGSLRSTVVTEMPLRMVDFVLGHVRRQQISGVESGTTNVVSMNVWNVS